jgi:hypothetical protein
MSGGGGRGRKINNDCVNGSDVKPVFLTTNYQPIKTLTRNRGERNSYLAKALIAHVAGLLLSFLVPWLILDRIAKLASSSLHR